MSAKLFTTLAEIRMSDASMVRWSVARVARERLRLKPPPASRPASQPASQPASMRARHDGVRASVVASTALAGQAALTLTRDADLVRACLEAGGFPRAEIIEGRRVLLAHDGAPWRPTDRKD